MTKKIGSKKQTKNLDVPEVDVLFSLDDVELGEKIRRCGAEGFRRSGAGKKKIRRCGGKKVLDDPELTKLDDTA